MILETPETTRLAGQFRALAHQWQAACSLLSSTSAMTAHPAYHAIIALGHPVVPFLLQDLQTNKTHWFEALKAITGNDPVSPKDWGNIPAMTEAWLTWGRAQNLI